MRKNSQDLEANTFNNEVGLELLAGECPPGILLEV